MKLFRLLSFTICILCLSGWRPARADAQLVASLDVLGPSVTMRRAGTEAFVNISKETLVGVGDTVRTSPTARARITFFANGTDTEVQPSSEIHIDDFSGTEDKFTISLTVVLGQTTQRIAKLLDSNSSYTINSTGLELAVRGTSFDVRVEPSGRSALIVKTGAVATKNSGTPPTAINRAPAANAEVGPGFGVRAEAGKGLSDVVRASSFAQLDSALDGCGSLISTAGDVRLNVRTGPGLSFARIGQLENNFRQGVLGVTETTKWYRVVFKGGFGWVFAPALKLDATCPGLRKFPDTFGPEDTALYQGLEPGYNPNIPDPTAQP